MYSFRGMRGEFWENCDKGTGEGVLGIVVYGIRKVIGIRDWGLGIREKYRFDMRRSMGMNSSYLPSANTMGTIEQRSSPFGDRRQ